MVNDSRTEKDAVSTACIVTSPIVMIVMASNIIVWDIFQVHTMMGSQGLVQMRDLCAASLIAMLVNSALIYPLTALFVFVYCNSLGRKMGRRRGRLIFTAVAAAVCLIFMPCSAEIDMQADIAGCNGPAVFKCAKLLYLTDKDIREGHVELFYSGRSMLVRNEYGDYEHVYTFETPERVKIGQIGKRDVNRFADGVFTRVSHEFTVSRNSRMLAAVDGFGEAEKVPRNYITFSYDEENKVLTREPVCENEDELPRITLVITEDGRKVLRHPFNGMTEFHLNFMSRRVYTFRVELDDFARDRHYPVSEVFTIDNR